MVRPGIVGARVGGPFVDPSPDPLEPRRQRHARDRHHRHDATHLCGDGLCAKLLRGAVRPSGVFSWSGRQFHGARPTGTGEPSLAELVSIYGIWVVAAFIALESVGIPLPAEAALIAACFFAARTRGIEISSLITAGIVAAIFGEVVGFWIGRRFGHQLLMRYGPSLGVTEGRIRIGQWLFVRYGGRFVFIARFLPFLRNIAAVLAGTNSMVAA